MQSGDRMPLRSLQNELLGMQHNVLPGTRMAFRDAVSRKSDPSPVSARHSPVAVILPEEVQHLKENLAGFQTVEYKSGVHKNNPHSLISVQPDFCSTEPVRKCTDKKQLDGEKTDYLAEGSDHVTNVMLPVIGEDAADQQCDNEMGHITMKSFTCTGGQIEISDASKLSEETIPPLPEDQASRSHVLCANDSNAIEDLKCGAGSSNSGHKDHAYCLEKERSISGTELSGSERSVSIRSEAGASENRVQTDCESLPESCPESSEDIDEGENFYAATNQESSSELHPTVQAEQIVEGVQDADPDVAVKPLSKELSGIANWSMPRISLSLAASPVLKAVGWEDCAVSSTPVVGNKPQVDVSLTLHCDSREASAAQEVAGTSSESALSVLHSTCHGSLSGSSKDPFTLISPKIWLSQSTCLQELTHDSAPPRCEFLGCVLEDGDALPQRSVECTPAALEKQRTLLGGRLSSLWTENLESPIPLPQLNSTTLSNAPCGPRVEKTTVEPVVLPKPFQVRTEPLQQQLLQMAELLIRTSGTLSADLAAKQHSTGTWTSPVRLSEHGVNTSGIFERKKEISVAEASTSTDSLLWNLSPGSLSSASRPELEQRLTSMLIVVEALTQQLSYIRAQSQAGGPGPSELREKLVQTDHTELNQVVMYKELYVKALEKISALELDQDSLRNLVHGVQDVKAAMAAITTETKEALAGLNEITCVASNDRDEVCNQMVQVRALYRRCQEVLKRMREKASGCLQEREQMRQRMEEAFQAKQAAFDATEQLRAHCALRIADLEQSLGSHLEVKDALVKAYQAQVPLNQEYMESHRSANELLEGCISSQNSLHEELCRARRLLQRTGPILLKMHERTAGALSKSKTWEKERDQAVTEKNRVEDELAQAMANLQDATQQIGGLNLQMEIMKSEMCALRQRLNEAEEERDELRMKSTEMSASVSSIQASYAFLQQALADETHKLQRASEEAREATERVRGLEAALGASQDQVRGLGQALAERDRRLEGLQKQAESHVQQLRNLRELQGQLATAKEMNEFLQMENELSREQVLETGSMLKAHLQSLRERNLQCEDLQQALAHLQRERDLLQEELDSTQERARRMLLNMGEQLVQASVEVALLHHRVRGLTVGLQGALTDGKPSGASKEPASQVVRRTAGSFVDTVMDAISTDQGQSCETEAAGEGLEQAVGRSSAFTCVVPTAPKNEPQEDQNNVLELLSGLGEAVSELGTTISRLQELKHAKQAKMESTVSSLQGELQELSHKHRCEVADLKQQTSRLQAQLDQNAVALQQKAQEEKTLRKLCVEVDQTQELLEKHRSENKELRREVTGLQLSLQQARLEAQTLREQLSGASGLSADCLETLNEKIQLRSEVEKLKRDLAKSENSRFQLVDRAKRHQVIHESNQRKLEHELQLLDEMIENVRKTLSSVPAVVQSCPELQRLVEYIG